MHILRLTWQNISLFFKRKPFLAVLLLIGFICANFFSLYLMTTLVGDLHSLKTNIEAEKVISIDCSSHSPYVDQAFVMQQFEESGVDFSSTFLFSLDNDNLSGEALNPVDNLFLMLVDSIDEEIVQNQYAVNSGRYLSEDDLTNSSNNCCISIQLADFSTQLEQVGTNITLVNDEFTLVGIMSDTIYATELYYGSVGFVIVPYTSVDSESFPLYSIELKTNGTITDAVKDKVSSIVSSFAPYAEITWPATYQESSGSIISVIIITWAIVALALINVLTVLIAWIQMNRANLYATYVAGASKAVLYAVIALQVLAIDLMSLPFAGVLYALSAELRTWGKIYSEPSPMGKVVILLGVAALMIAISLFRSWGMIQHIEDQKGKV